MAWSTAEPHMQSTPLAGIILAAGKGTRMKSDIPKGLHAVCGLPMAEHVGRALKLAGVSRPVVVVGFGGQALMEALGNGYVFAEQREQYGTGHATMCAATVLADFDGPVVVASGDTPMLEAGTIEALVQTHLAAAADATVATCVVSEPHGYGRVVRDPDGQFARIVEHKDADEAQRAIREVNAGLYCFDAKTLFRVLPQIKNANAQGEYYLTDVPEAIVREGGRVAARIFDDPSLLAGVNDRWQLAEIDLVMRRRIIRRHAVAGVTFRDVDSVSIGADVQIGRDTVIEPNTILRGKTTIGCGCLLGPFTFIDNCTVGTGARVICSYLEDSTVGEEARIGPYARLRAHAEIGPDSRIGNYVEVKNSSLGRDVKVSHLSYIGDAQIGDDTNVGAGTITCNFDGFDKHRTTIGAHAFVGSNTTLIAPVEVGDGAITAAGSVITESVPGGAMAFGRARQETKEGRAEAWRNAKRASKKS
jgi:bifunctional UDP-N-acetylglucosamine pyrophosphorylase/glucosamine-1-phosphate N-acetyltransferase